MRTMLKTTNKKEADEKWKELAAQYGKMAVYTFQYRSIDGNFYYEILLNDNWL